MSYLEEIEMIDQAANTMNADPLRRQLKLLVKSFRAMRKVTHDLTLFTERKTPAWVDGEFEKRMVDGGAS